MAKFGSVTTDEAGLRLLYDETCRLCAGSAKAAEAMTGNRVVAVPLEDGPSAGDVVLEMPSGRVVGVRAWLAVMRLGPWWARALSAVLGVPPLLWLAAVGYRLVARTRHLLFGRCTSG
ncbi:MAG: hypothetical protein AKCLJLPJ_01288 [Fimbriimonadales bacterium]|nr:hypothetical protein [Fimbriimonadales bacterium]